MWPIGRNAQKFVIGNIHWVERVESPYKLAVQYNAGRLKDLLIELDKITSPAPCLILQMYMQIYLYDN